MKSLRQFLNTLANAIRNAMGNKYVYLAASLVFCVVLILSAPFLNVCSRYTCGWVAGWFALFAMYRVGVLERFVSRVAASPVTPVWGRPMDEDGPPDWEYDVLDDIDREDVEEARALVIRPRSCDCPNCASPESCADCGCPESCDCHEVT